MLMYSIIAKLSGATTETVVSRGWAVKAEAMLEARELENSGAYAYVCVMETPVPTAKVRHYDSFAWPDVLEVPDSNLEFERSRSGDLEITTEDSEGMSVYRTVRAVDVPALIAFLQKEFPSAS